MKTFYAAVTVFLLLISVMSINFIYINRKSDELTSMVASLPSVEEEGCEDAVSELEKVWEKYEKIFSLSVVRTTTERMTELILSLRHYASAKNSDEYERHRLLLGDNIEEARRLEAFSLLNVL